MPKIKWDIKYFIQKLLVDKYDIFVYNVMKEKFRQLKQKLKSYQTIQVVIIYWKSRSCGFS